MPNLKMIRVQSKLDELFNNKIDLAEGSYNEERKNKKRGKLCRKRFLQM